MASITCKPYLLSMVPVAYRPLLLYSRNNSLKKRYFSYHCLVVIAGSKGKERFRRPLRKGSNSSRLRRPSLPPLSSTCRSPLGAGVPAEVRWSWPRHVFGKGFICLSFISLLLVLLHSPIPIISLFSFAHPPLPLVDYLLTYFR